MKTLDRVLEEHPFLEGLQPRHLEVLSGCASNFHVPGGELLAREGQPADDFYLLRHGKVALEIFNLEHGPITIQTLEAGDVVGWSWLVAPFRWRFDARALELVRATKLDGHCLRRKCEADNELGYELMKRFASLVSTRLEATRLQLLDIYGRRL